MLAGPRRMAACPPCLSAHPRHRSTHPICLPHLPPTPLLQVRMVPQRPGIAFVEYDDAGQAGMAMQGLNGFKLATDKPMAITFAKQA